MTVVVLAFLANRALLTSESFSIAPILENALLLGGAIYLAFFLFYIDLALCGVNLFLSL